MDFDWLEIIKKIGKFLIWIIPVITLERIINFFKKIKPLNDFEKNELKILRIIDTQIKANKTRLSSNDFLEIETNFLKQSEYINSLIKKGYFIGELQKRNTLGGGKNQFVIVDYSITHAGEQYLNAHKRYK